MNLTDCYQLLGLRLGASIEDIKGAYRRLARQYHPDVNPDDQSKEKFIAISAAYQTLLQLAQVADSGHTSTTSQPRVKVATSPSQKRAATQSSQTESATPTPPPSVPERPAVKVNVQVRQGTTQTPAVNLSPNEVVIKTSGFHQLQDLLKQKRFPRAVTLAEGLGQRLPQDPEVRQWQAIAYQQLGRDLIGKKQFEQARVYLKKALKTDPHNKSLWAEVENDFRHLEKMY